MLSVEDLLNILERTPGIPSLIDHLTGNGDNYSTVQFSYYQDLSIYEDVTNAFELIARSGPEPSNNMNGMKYPIMIYNDDLPGYFVVLLSEDEAIIHEFSHTYRIVSVEDAFQFIDDTIKNGYLDNIAEGPAGLLYVEVDEDIDIDYAIRVINRAYVNIIREAVNIDGEELLMIHEQLFNKNYNVDDIPTLQSLMISNITEFYLASMTTLREMHDELPVQ